MNLCLCVHGSPVSHSCPPVDLIVPVNILHLPKELLQQQQRRQQASQEHSWVSTVEAIAWDGGMLESRVGACWQQALLVHCSCHPCCVPCSPASRPCYAPMASTPAANTVESMQGWLNLPGCPTMQAMEMQLCLLSCTGDLGKLRGYATSMVDD